MKAGRQVRAMRALLRIGLLETVAYRGELLVWVLTSTMPLIMLALYSTVVEEAPLGRYGGPEIVSYFLATFIVRQLTSSWISWQINMEVRDGTLATRLIRPVHPLLAYTAESIAAVPMRVIVSIPVAVILLVLDRTRTLTTDPVIWIFFVVSILGAWTISLCVSAAIGALAFFMESSAKIMDVWLALFFVFSGYLVPVDLFPPRLRAALDFLPFRYQIGLPVELMTAAHGRREALALLGGQWAFVLLTAATVVVLWRRGLARFAAYGG